MKNHKFTSLNMLGVLALVLSMGTSLSISAQVAPANISQSFDPPSILQGEISKISFLIENLPVGVDASFISTLPAGLIIANPANAVSSCGAESPSANDGRNNGVVTAVAGGSVISYSKDAVVVGDSCLVEVDVLSTAIGVYVNPAVTLSYGDSTSSSNTATLTVTGGGDSQNPAPVFSKSFSPGVIGYGGRSTLSFTIDNSLGGNVTTINFSDNLPNGMLVANPANLTSTCPIGSAPGSDSILTAVAGSDVISYSSSQVAALPAYDLSETVCTISVDVIVNAVGEVINISEELTTTPFGAFTPVSSGKAVASITANGGHLELQQEFVGDPIYAGGTVDLVYVLQNTDRTYPATDVGFSDDLDVTLSGLLIDSVLQTDCDGSISTGAGSALVYSGGTLGPESSCSITLALQVPGAAPTGQYLNSTSVISGTSTVLVTTEIVDEFGDTISETTEVIVTVTGEPASDTLFVSPIPILTKAFSEDTVAAGITTTIDLVFTIENTSTDFSATDVTFVDELTAFLPLPINATLPVDPCGAGSTLALTNVGVGGQGLILTAGSLDPAASCTFTVVLTLPEGLPGGTYTNTTGAVTATIDGSTVTGLSATDSFLLVAPPTLTKQFTNDPVAAGQTATLEFTLKNTIEDAAGTASAITFSDDLDGTVTGMVVFSGDPVFSLPPVADVCGTGSELEFSPGNNLLTLKDGVLAPGETCNFSVDVLVPAGTVPGSYTNSTSGLMAEVGGLSLLGPSANADLMVGGLVLGKEFTPSVALPDSTVDITYTLMNLSGIAATAVAFSDSLNGTLAGLTVSNPGDFPIADVCGAGSSLILNGTLLLLTNGSVDMLDSCSFAVVLDIPDTADAGVYSNLSSPLSYEIDGSPLVGDPASARLTIVTDTLTLSKEFMADSVCPGSSTTLRFTLTNLFTQDINDVAFTDDLESALGDMTAEDLPTTACGGSAVLNNTVIEFTGGFLAAGTSCSFDVVVTVDPSTPSGSVASNVTSTITGTTGGVAVSGAAAADDMQIDCIEFSKSFGGDSTVLTGGTTQLSFTLQNTNAATGVSDLSFSDDLDAMIDGAAATGLPLLNVCGDESVIDGTDVVTLSRGSLLPAGSCTITIDVEVPDTTLAGTYENITSELFWGGVAAADPATASLTVLPPADGDGDGVLDDVDVCLNTVIPEGVPTVKLLPNRYALVDDDSTFDVGANGNSRTKSKNQMEPEVFTIEDTAGCSCEQIIVEADLGDGHTKHGCSLGAMRDWVEFVELPLF